LIEFSVLPGNLSPISARLFPISFWASISTISSSSLQISFCDEKYALIRTDEKMHDLSVKPAALLAKSTMLGTKLVLQIQQSWAPIRCHLQHQLVPLCPLLGCLPINRQCIQAYLTHHKRGREE